MLIVKLKAGLGNQLFQYAMGRSLALRRNTDMKLDKISGFKNDIIYKRTYSPWCFNIIENFASEEEIAKFNKIGIHTYSYKILSKFIPYHRRSVIEQDTKSYLYYDRNLELVRDNVYLDGYWQNENYFSDIEDIIRREFTFKFPPDFLNQKIAEQIKNTNSISIHLRRLLGISADKKVKIQQAVDFHGACTLDYYQTTINNLTKIITNPHFFIFSDDAEWGEKNLRLDYPTLFIKHNNGLKDYEDLRLMSLCKHHIIANSSFSWWAAWLCANPEKIIFAPEIPGYAQGLYKRNNASIVVQNLKVS